MADAVTPEVAKVEAKHFAAGMVDRTSLDREVRAMQNLRNKKDGQAVFEKEVEIPDANLKEPNFKELNDIALEIDSTVNPVTRESRQSLVQKKLDDLKNVINKETPLTPRQLQYIGNVAADIPGVVKSIAKDTGRTEAQVKADLKAAAPSVAPILDELANSRDFVNLLRKNVGAIEPSEEMIKRSGQIESLDKKVTREQTDIDDTRKVYDDPIGRTGAKQWYGGLSAADKLAIPSAVQDYQNMVQELNDPVLGRYNRSSINRGELPGYITGLQRELQNLFPGQSLATLTAPGGIDAQALAKLPVNAARGIADTNENARNQLITKAEKYLSAMHAAEGIEAVYARRAGAGGNLDNELGKYKLYSEADEKLRGLKGREDALDAEKAQLKTLQTMQAKDVASVAGKVESVMERSVKEYYNEKMLKRAKEIAEWDAAHKTELKQKEADLKEKREQITKSLLEKYMRMSFLKYRNGEAIGWNDKELKKLVKEDLFQHSPADMGRELLKRIYSERGDWPDTFKKEIDALAKEMGVDSRTTFNSIIDKMDTKVLGDYAADEMPKAFGYARARGYYFDRLRLKRHQVEYVRSTYPENFFENMLEHQKEFLIELGDEKNKDLLRSIDMTLRKLRNATVGKDYEEGMKKALKLATAAAVATAGTYFIGGPYTLGKIARAAANTGVAASAAATYGVRHVADAVDLAANKAVAATNYAWTGPRIPVNPSSQFGQGVNSVNEFNSSISPAKPNLIPTVQ